MVTLVQLVKANSFDNIGPVDKEDPERDSILKVRMEEQKIMAYVVSQYLRDHSVVSTLQLIAALKKSWNSGWIRNVTTGSYTVNDPFELSQFEKSNAFYNVVAARFVIGQGNPHLFGKNMQGIQHAFLHEAIDQVLEQNDAPVAYVDKRGASLDKTTRNTILYYANQALFHAYINSRLSPGQKPGHIYSVEY